MAETKTRSTAPARQAKEKPVAPTRRVKASRLDRWRRRKVLRPAVKGVPSAFKVTGLARRLLMKRWRLFAGIVLVYLLLTVVLVKGFSVSSNLGDTKTVLQQIFQGNWGQFVTGFALFGVLLGTSGGASSDVAGAYQSVLLVVISLVLIWALRQTHAGTKVRVKESFYKGLYPLIQFVLVLLVVVLQLLPVVAANFLYRTVFGTGLAVSVLEKTLWGLLVFGLIVWSFYMLTASLFALYVVTLPDVTPIQALRSARDLVRYRRWTIMRKVLFLPLLLVILGAIIMVPVIIFATPVAEWLFLILTMTALAVIHAYMYTLYRELL